jgi:SEC-C motif-containing protein
MAVGYPENPKDLLKARYEAFVRGDVDFILESHHPETRSQVDRESIRKWSQESKWLGLEVEGLEDHQDHAHIRFKVEYERDFSKFTHAEIADFRKYEERWYYYDSEFPNPETNRRSQEKIGRNDPCHCGSGKKFKKCHAQI